MTFQIARTTRLLPLLVILTPVLLRADAPTKAIRADAIRTDIAYLASDELAGRGSGTKGNEQAARYVASAFKNAGLKPVGTSKQNDAQAQPDGSGYFQPFTFIAGVARGKSNTLEGRLGDKTVRYHVGTEFEPSGISGGGKVAGDVVFVGYGIVSKEPARDDYAGLDVSRKIVLLIAGAPGNDPHSPLMERAGIREKAITARDKGAAAIIVMLPAANDVPRMNADESPTDAGLPIIIVRRSVAAEWIRAAGKSLDSVEQSLASGPAAFDLQISVTLAAVVKKVTKTTANIAGLLEGSDPVLKNEVVVIGAHMDHLGMGGTGSLAEDHRPTIHHGADDNASGTAGVLSLASYFASQPVRPKRSLLFLCFSGEELGLLGSMHYVKNPPIPNERVAAMLNMDMIGRMKENKLSVLGASTSPAWAAILDDVNRSAGLTLARGNESGFGASDQQSFYLQKIPVLFFFTGLHADYHKPSDTADKINADGEASVVEFVAGCASRIADMPTRPAYQQIAQDAAPAARFRVSLGTIPDYSAEVEGVMLSGVRAGSGAEKAGLKQGDIIVKFGGRSIRNVQEYTIALSEHNPGDVVEIVVKRGTETITLTATLAGSRR